MKKLLLAGLALCLLTPLAQAQSSLEAGDWLVRAGIGYVDPDSNGLNVGGSNLAADSAVAVDITVEYMLPMGFGIELLASTPFAHDLELDGQKIGETDQLPPTLSVNWHLPLGAFVPYVGVGVNWTIFFNEELDSSLDSVLALEDSWGLAGQLGLDWILSNNLVINGAIRYISIETDAHVGGALAGGGAAALGEVKINPWVYTLNVGYKF